MSEPPYLSLAGKTAVVLGASSGFGRIDIAADLITNALHEGDSR